MKKTQIIQPKNTSVSPRSIYTNDNILKTVAPSYMFDVPKSSSTIPSNNQIK